MFSEYESDIINDERPEKTDKIQRSHNFRKNLFSAIGFSLAGVYFVATLAWNPGAIIWAIFQVIGWITFGILCAYDNYVYVSEEKVSILKSKEQDLARFLIENTSRQEFTEKFVEQPKEEEQEEVVVEMTEEEAKEKGLL